MKSLPALIGVIHLPALPGAPRSSTFHPSLALEKAGLQAVKEARLLSEAGFEALILENFGDAPFYSARVPPETIASLAMIAAAVRETTKIPIGINVLRNDAHAALAIAAVTGCHLVRINVLSGVVASDQGIIEGQAAGLLRERERLGADVSILADVHVKHAQTLSSQNLSLAIEETALRALADGVILSGEGTGRAVDLSVLKEGSRTARLHRIPLFVGSGVTAETILEIRPLVHGVIVSSTLRQGGKAGMPLDSKRVGRFLQAWKKKPKHKK